jgi:hypothetical protein
MALPDWLLPEFDDSAAKQGVLRPDAFPDRSPSAGVAGSNTFSGSQRQQLPPTSYASLDAVASGLTKARSAERHAAVQLALSGGSEGASGGQDAVDATALAATANWAAPIPATQPEAPSYPLWLAPELDVLAAVNPGAFPLAPLPAPPGKLDPALSAAAARDRPAEKIFHMQRAEPGDSLLVMSRNERPGWPVASAGAVAANAPRAGGQPSGSRAGGGNAGARGYGGPSFDDWSGDGGSGEAPAGDGYVPKPMPAIRGNTIADTIYARVATYEKDARKGWQ